MSHSEGARQRRLQHKEHLRREILDAAGQLFAEEGYEHVTVRRVAERIQYSQGVIFYYFRNKAEILTALCEETFSGLGVRFEQLKASHVDPLDRLLAASRAFVEFATTHPHHYRVVLTPPPLMDGEDSVERIGRLGQALFTELGRLYEDCCRVGAFRPSDPFSAGLSWWNCLSGLIVFFNMHRNSAWVNRQLILEQTLAVLAAGHKALTK
jgi:AcrR family transcriptional regulator